MSPSRGRNFEKFNVESIIIMGPQRFITYKIKTKSYVKGAHDGESRTGLTVNQDENLAVFHSADSEILNPFSSPETEQIGGWSRNMHSIDTAVHSPHA